MPDNDSTVPPADPNAPHTVVQLGPPGAAAALPAIPGYELHGEIGSGGMGVVYAARDTALNRSVAVKFLRTTFPTAGPVVQRFLDEAQISGQLQHPGIPPVHQVGALPDGRPFLVMKLIKGRTLHAILAERTDRAEDRGRFVAVFEQICLAVGYAHSRGVVHRDLKPLNVMVGAFGEVQLMDWGLAKVVGAPNQRSEGPVPGTTIRSVRELGSETQAGSVLGSPSFMPPEQAGGEVAKIDPRSDVFGLGAVLCVILTGEPPYTGADVNEIHLKAIRGRTEDALARLDASGAEPELVALCKRCLATDPTERPADGGAVASVVAAFRADAELRARQAELDRVRAEGELVAARATAVEQRKRRRVQLALFASVALLLLAGVAFAWWDDHRTTTAKQRDDLRAANERAEEDRRKAHTEREVAAALAEVNALCDRGNQETDNPPRWRLTLAAARSAHRRASAAREAGPASAELDRVVAEAAARLARDEFDCETVELCEKWVADLFMMTDVRLEYRSGPWRQFKALLARLDVHLETTATEVAADRIRGHRFGPRLMVLMFMASWFEVKPGTPLLKLRTVLSRSSHPLQPSIVDALRRGIGLREILVSDQGRALTSGDLVALFLTCEIKDQNDDALRRLLLDEAIRRNPGDLVALLLRTPNSDGPIDPVETLGLPLRARPVLLTDNRARSIAAIATIVALRPTRPEVWTQLGYTLTAYRVFDWAAECHRRAIELDATRVYDHAALADALLEANRVEEAVEVYRKTFQKFPHVALAFQAKAAKAMILLACDPEAATKERTPQQQLELRREALGLLRDWLTLGSPSRPELLEARQDRSFRFVRHPLYLAALPSAEANRWLDLWEEVRTTWGSGITFEFVGGGAFLEMGPPGTVLDGKPRETAPPPREK